MSGRSTVPLALYAEVADFQIQVAELGQHHFFLDFAKNGVWP
jgi:hypothetical protein